MRRKSFILFAAAIAGVLMLTACTSSENEDMVSAGAGTSVSADSQTVEGQATGSQGSGSGDTALVGVTDGQQSTSQDVSGTTGTSADSTGTSSAVGTSSNGTASSGGTTGSTTSDDTVTGEFDGVYQDGADEDGDIWSGTYTDGEETIRITYIDKETISFSFSQSGIYGKATVDGTQAVFNGDDYHVVVFSIQGDTVTVDVASEEDYDTSESPLIGTYTKEQENPET